MFASTTNANSKNCLRKRYVILKATLKHSCRSYSTSGLEYVKIFAYKIKNDQLLPQYTTVFQISSILLHTIKLLKHQSVCMWAGQESHFHLHLSWWSEAMDYREVFSFQTVDINYKVGTRFENEQTKPQDMHLVAFLLWH